MNKQLLMMIMLAPLALGACGGKSETDEARPTQARQDHVEGEEGPHEEGESHGQDERAERGDDIELSAEEITAAGIDVVEAGPAKIRESLPLYGVIAPNAERVREVIARYPGVIRTVTKQVGDAVRQGETLATVESDESLETYPVVAPIAGVVTARSANPGEQTADKVLFTVADLSSVWVELSLFPRDLAKVRIGQPVRVSNADAGMGAEGKITYVAPLGTAASQTLAARVLLENAERRWAPGLYVTAEVTLSETQVNVAIRNQALQTLEGRNVVFARTGNGFDPHPVRLGRTDSEHTEIVEGLAAGESYASRNSFILKAEIGKGEAEHEH